MCDRTRRGEGLFHPDALQAVPNELRWRRPVSAAAQLLDRDRSRGLARREIVLDIVNVETASESDDSNRLALSRLPRKAIATCHLTRVHAAPRVRGSTIRHVPTEHRLVRETENCGNMAPQICRDADPALKRSIVSVRVFNPEEFDAERRRERSECARKHHGTASKARFYDFQAVIGGEVSDQIRALGPAAVECREFLASQVTTLTRQLFRHAVNRFESLPLRRARLQHDGDVRALALIGSFLFELLRFR